MCRVSRIPATWDTRAQLTNPDPCISRDAPGIHVTELTNPCPGQRSASQLSGIHVWSPRMLGRSASSADGSVRIITVS